MYCLANRKVWTFTGSGYWLKAPNLRIGCPRRSTSPYVQRSALGSGTPSRRRPSPQWLLVPPSGGERRSGGETICDDAHSTSSSLRAIGYQLAVGFLDSTDHFAPDYRLAVPYSAAISTLLTASMISATF